MPDSELVYQKGSNVKATWSNLADGAAQVLVLWPANDAPATILRRCRRKSDAGAWLEVARYFTRALEAESEKLPVEDGNRVRNLLAEHTSKSSVGSGGIWGLVVDCSADSSSERGGRGAELKELWI